MHSKAVQPHRFGLLTKAEKDDFIREKYKGKWRRKTHGKSGRETMPQLLHKHLYLSTLAQTMC